MIFKSTATADDNPLLLTLQTGETDLAANDVIGKIAFQAPDEGTGTDAVLVSAAIQAVAEGDHSASSNATSLQFMTGASEAATEKMRIDSSGNVSIGSSGSSLYFQNGFNDRTARIVNGGASGSSNLRFYTNNAGTEAEELRITPSGNVNIGGNYAQTTYTSQITGTLNVTGNITQNGATVTTTGKAIAMAMIFGG